MLIFFHHCIMVSPLLLWHYCILPSRLFWLLNYNYSHTLSTSLSAHRKLSLHISSHQGYNTQMKSADNSTLLYHCNDYSFFIHIRRTYQYFLPTHHLLPRLQRKTIGLRLLRLKIRSILSDDEACGPVVQLEFQNHIIWLVCWQLRRFWEVRGVKWSCLLLS